MSRYYIKLCQNATYLRVHEDDKLLQCEEVIDVIQNFEKRVSGLESNTTELLQKYIDEALNKKMLESQIAELEKENLILKAHFCLNKLEGHIDKIMLDKIQAKRDLEQGIAMIQDFTEALVREPLVFNFDNVDLFEEKYINNLREQAKGGDL